MSFLLPFFFTTLKTAGKVTREGVFMMMETVRETRPKCRWLFPRIIGGKPG
jgi:hypothetical protein